MNIKLLKAIKGFEENRFVHKLCKTCGFLKRLEGKRGHNENK